MSTTNPNPNNPQLQGSLSTLQDPPGDVIAQTGHLQVSTTNPNPNNPQLQGSLSTLQDGTLSLRQDISRCTSTTNPNPNNPHLTTPSCRAPSPPSRMGRYHSDRTSPGAYN